MHVRSPQCTYDKGEVIALKRLAQQAKRTGRRLPDNECPELRWDITK